LGGLLTWAEFGDGRAIADALPIFAPYSFSNFPYHPSIS
jgi:hypothetical protein